VRAGALRSAHDVAEGGLAVALAECCLAGDFGARVDLAALRPGGEALLFGEGPGAFVVSGDAQSLRAFGGAAVVIGSVGGSDLAIDGVLSMGVPELTAAHAGGLADLLS
jgi:phosphoribosylformylglycinamidine synthase subunit PurL